MNAVCKFEIYLNNKSEYKIIHELMFEQKKVMNTAINAAYEFFTFKLDYKEKHGLFPKPNEILQKCEKAEFYKTFDGYIDSFLGKKYIQNCSSNRTSAVKKAIGRFNNDRIDILKGEKTLCVFKKSNCITLHNRSINLHKEDKKYFADISLLSCVHKKQINRESGKFLFNLIVSDNSQRSILSRIFEEKYSIKESQLRYDKKNKKFMLFLTYSFEQISVERLNIMGIDMGIIYPVYMAIFGTLKRYKITGGEIEAFRKKVEAERYKKRQQLLVAGKGRKGRGRNCMLKNVTKISDKISRFRNLINDRYSKRIIDLAIRENCKEIRMENLSGISKDNLFLKNWTYYDLQSKITYKAEKEGINVILIDPKYTSQTCSKCGFKDKENRKSQSKFICKNCDFSENADYNAAFNIANPDFGIAGGDLPS